MARRASATTLVPPPPSAPRSGTSLPPPAAAAGEGIALQACLPLLDRLAAAEEAAFLVQWLEAVLAGRPKPEPALSVRLLRAYRDSGRLERARELAQSLPQAPATWGPLDAARLALERTMLALIDGRADLAEQQLKTASRSLTAATRGGLREQLDLHLLSAQLEIKRNHTQQAAAALRLAEHVADRMDDGAWRVPVAMAFGHLAMRVGEPEAAARHFVSALSRAPARGVAALTAHGNAAIAFGSMGRFEEARAHAGEAIVIGRDTQAGWRHADAHDVLAIVEIAADRPGVALGALEEAHGLLGELDQPTLRYQLAAHRTWALAMLGRGQAARQSLARTERLRAELGAVDAIDEQDLVATRARTLEACGEYAAAVAAGRPHAGDLPDAFVTGSLNLVLGRCALAQGDTEAARAAVERASLSGYVHGWVYPDRAAGGPLWDLAKASGDSRVVRYAERIVTGTFGGPPSTPEMLPRSPPSDRSLGVTEDVYVSTREGVVRVKVAGVAESTHDAALVVDTVAHTLRAGGKTMSLERRRALEPLLAQLLRRAREGLSADEILRAAGGPGPDSADAEHRVRVLISRVRDLLGDPNHVERLRDAGEHGKTRYRLAPDLVFALVEPAFS